MESECNPTKSNDGQIHWEQHFLAIGNRKRKPLPYETRQEDQRCDLKTPSCICHWCCSHHQLGDLIGGEKAPTTTTTIKLLYKERFKTCRNKIQRTLYLSPSFLLQETWGKKPRKIKIKIEKKEKEELRRSRSNSIRSGTEIKKYVLLRQKKQPRRRTPEEGQQTMALMIAPSPHHD
jgi:hypothetical protein